MSYDNDMQVIVSKVVSDKPNAPVMRVNLEINGQKLKSGLWVWTRRDGSPVLDKAGNKQYKGTLEVDDFVPRASEAPANDPEPFDDDLPF